MQLQHFFCTYSYLLELIYAFLTFGHKCVRALAGPIPKIKVLWYMQNSQ